MCPCAFLACGTASGPARSRKLTAYVEDLERKTAAARKAAQEFEKDYRAAVQRRYNAGRIDPGYVVGEKVWLATDLLLKKVHDAKRRLEYTWTGPWLVKETVGPAVVRITRGVGGDEEVKTVHVERLKRGDAAASASAQRRIGDYVVAERSAAGAGQGTQARQQGDAGASVAGPAKTSSASSFPSAAAQQAFAERLRVVRTGQRQPTAAPQPQL
eukprot:m51a1_g10025 hypothetical protein (214) ;mRNA; r:102104-104393